MSKSFWGAKLDFVKTDATLERQLDFRGSGHGCGAAREYCAFFTRFRSRFGGACFHGFGTDLGFFLGPNIDLKSIQNRGWAQRHPKRRPGGSQIDFCVILGRFWTMNRSGYDLGRIPPPDPLY